MKKLAIVVVLGAATLGCATESRGTIDAPVKHPADNSPANVVNMPNGWPNVAWKCAGPNGIYQARRDVPVVVVPNDPNCRG